MTRHCEPPRGARPRDAGTIEATHVEVVPEVRLEERLVARHDSDAAGRERVECLGVGPCDVLDRPDELQVLGADRRHEHGRRPGDGAKLGDLADAAHAHLRDEHARVGLEAQHREREAELVVAARLGGDRRCDRARQRAERILRRGLPGRADDGDDLRVRAAADEGRERRESGLLVVRDERRRSPCTCIVDEPGAGVERDEKVARPGVARVVVDAADDAVGRPPVEPAEPERLDLLPAERDHRVPRAPSP